MIVVTIIVMYIERVPNRLPARRAPARVLPRGRLRSGSAPWPTCQADGAGILLKGGVEVLRDPALPPPRTPPPCWARPDAGPRLLDRRPSRMPLALAMIDACVLDPRSNRGLRDPGRHAGATGTARDGGGTLGRKGIERTLAAKQIEDGSLVLCDLTRTSRARMPAGQARLLPRRQARQAADATGTAVRWPPSFRGNVPIPAPWPPRAEKLAARFSLSRTETGGC